MEDLRIFTGERDEISIDAIRLKIRRTTEGINSFPKWYAIRLAFAVSLRGSKDLSLYKPIGGSEYSLKQITGWQNDNQTDYTHHFRVLLSVKHEVDLFAEGWETNFRNLMQNHIHRGLEILNAQIEGNTDLWHFLLETFSQGEVIAEQGHDKSREEKIIQSLSELGIDGTIASINEGPRIYRYRVHIESVDQLKTLKRRATDLKYYGLSKDQIFVQDSNEERSVFLDIPKPKSAWQTVSFITLEPALEAYKAELPVSIGVDVQGEPFLFDLKDSPHLMVAGTTGSGKSVCIHAIIRSLIYRLSSEELNFCLIDPKKVEFTPYNNANHLWPNQHVITDYSDAVFQLETLVSEMERRNDQLANLQVRSFDEAKNKGLKEPWLVVVIDELADLVLSYPDAQEHLVRLAQKGRSSGIHLILGTQRPDATTFSGLLRANIPSRIALTVQKSTESRIILDENGAEMLSGAGDMLVKLVGKKTCRLHGALVDVTETAKLMKEG